MDTVEETKKVVYKVIVIGDANVGKTSLTYRFCENKFLETPETTIGVDFRQRVLNIDGEIITLQLWDTAGLERHRRSMVQHYYRNVHAVIFVYDVSNMKSFDSLKEWIEECDKNTFCDALRVMVGNKCDEEPVVNRNMAQKFADEHCMPLFETSAKLDSQRDNVDGVFLTIAHKLKNEKHLIRSQNNNIRLSSISNQPESNGWNCYC